MEHLRFKHLYGPLHSWRLGVSLGIDPVSVRRKICNLDCVYCQLGRTARFTNKRRDFVSVKAVIAEIKKLTPAKIDYYTFSGRGEPTLAKNLGAMVRAVRRETSGKVAVITNAALMDDGQVQDDLMAADLVLAKLDACNDGSFKEVDVPAGGLRFDRILDGIKGFRRRYKGKMALQVMFIESNTKHAGAIAQIVRDIGADEIHINTPLRPGAATPVCAGTLLEIKKHFAGLPAVTVYEAQRRAIEPFDVKSTVRRHGNFMKEVQAGNSLSSQYVV